MSEPVSPRPASPEQVLAKAKAFVDALCKLPRGQYGTAPSAAFGEDYNRLRALALESLPGMDPRLLGAPVETGRTAQGASMCRASYVEIETYVRQIMEQMQLTTAMGRQAAVGGQESAAVGAPASARTDASGAYDVAEIRRTHTQAYQPWTEQDDAYLRERFEQGASVADLADEFGRQPGGIRSRLRKLGLV